MTRISRISTPRATLFAFTLLAIVIAGFGTFVNGARDAGVDAARVANEATAQPQTETSQHCAMSTLTPSVAMNRHTEDEGNVRL